VTVSNLAALEALLLEAGVSEEEARATAARVLTQFEAEDDEDEAADDAEAWGRYSPLLDAAGGPAGGAAGAGLPPHPSAFRLDLIHAVRQLMDAGGPEAEGGAPPAEDHGAAPVRLESLTVSSSGPRAGEEAGGAPGPADVAARAAVPGRPGSAPGRLVRPAKGSFAGASLGPPGGDWLTGWLGPVRASALTLVAAGATPASAAGTRGRRSAEARRRASAVDSALEAMRQRLAADGGRSVGSGANVPDHQPDAPVGPVPVRPPSGAASQPMPWPERHRQAEEAQRLLRQLFPTFPFPPDDPATASPHDRAGGGYTRREALLANLGSCAGGEADAAAAEAARAGDEPWPERAASDGDDDPEPMQRLDAFSESLALLKALSQATARGEGAMADGAGATVGEADDLDVPDGFDALEALAERVVRASEGCDREAGRGGVGAGDSDGDEDDEDDEEAGEDVAAEGAAGPARLATQARAKRKRLSRTAAAQADGGGSADGSASEAAGAATATVPEGLATQGRGGAPAAVAAPPSSWWVWQVLALGAICASVLVMLRVAATRAGGADVSGASSGGGDDAEAASPAKRGAGASAGGGGGGDAEVPAARRGPAASGGDEISVGAASAGARLPGGDTTGDKRARSDTADSTTSGSTAGAAGGKLSEAALARARRKRQAKRDRAKARQREESDVSAAALEEAGAEGWLVAGKGKGGKAEDGEEEGEEGAFGEAEAAEAAPDAPPAPDADAAASEAGIKGSAGGADRPVPAQGPAPAKAAKAAEARDAARPDGAAGAAPRQPAPQRKHAPAPASAPAPAPASAPRAGSDTSGGRGGGAKPAAALVPADARAGQGKRGSGSKAAAPARKPAAATTEAERPARGRAPAAAEQPAPDAEAGEAHDPAAASAPSSVVSTARLPGAHRGLPALRRHGSGRRIDVTTPRNPLPNAPARGGAASASSSSRPRQSGRASVAGSAASTSGGDAPMSPRSDSRHDGGGSSVGSHSPRAGPSASSVSEMKLRAREQLQRQRRVEALLRAGDEASIVSELRAGAANDRQCTAAMVMLRNGQSLPQALGTAGVVPLARVRSIVSEAVAAKRAADRARAKRPAGSGASSAASSRSRPGPGAQSVESDDAKSAASERPTAATSASSPIGQAFLDPSAASSDAGSDAHDGWSVPAHGSPAALPSSAPPTPTATPETEGAAFGAPAVAGADAHILPLPLLPPPAARDGAATSVSSGVGSHDGLRSPLALDVGVGLGSPSLGMGRHARTSSGSLSAMTPASTSPGGRSAAAARHASAVMVPVLPSAEAPTPAGSFLSFAGSMPSAQREADGHSDLGGGLLGLGAFLGGSDAHQGHHNDDDDNGMLSGLGSLGPGPVQGGSSLGIQGGGPDSHSLSLGGLLSLGGGHDMAGPPGHDGSPDDTSVDDMHPRLPSLWEDDDETKPSE